MQQNTTTIWLAGCLLLLGAAFASAQDIDDGSIFEVEGNASDDAPDGDDWETLVSGPGDSFAFTGILADPGSASQFTGGGSKDNRDISQWKHKDTGGFPDKDDITDAYAAAYEVDGDLVVYFGADRFANNGDAQLGFWFLQDEVQTLTGGTFQGVHHDGDILVLGHFQGGGTDPTIEVYMWEEGGPIDGVLRLLESGSAECGSGSVDDACAITNESDVPLFWPYEPKFGDPGIAPEVSFFEGAINLTDLLGGAGNVPCFTSFLAESRSSSSIDATLKDFVLGGFPVCELDLTKSCDTGDVNEAGDAFVYGYSGTVTNSGFGTLYGVEVVDDAGTPGDDSDDIVHEIGTLAGGASDTFSGSFESTLNPATNRASASGNTAPDGISGTEVTAEADPAECPSINIDPMIDVDKQCELALEVIAGQVVLRVDFGGQVCNETDEVPLFDVQVVDDGGTPEDTSDDQIVLQGVTLAKAGEDGDCETYTGSYYPSSASSTVPSAAIFSDTVTATAEPPLGFETATEMASAECPLCPPPDGS